MNPQPGRALPPVAWRWLLAIAAARWLLHVSTQGQYGFHRDELAVLDDARRLSWGYVAYPPLVPFLARIGMDTLGATPGGYRLFSGIAQAAATLLAGLMARELGGRRGAQLLSSLVLCCVPFSLLAGSMLQYTSLDYLWWVLAAWMLLRIANGGDPRGWLALGAVIGLGMLTRYTMSICAIGIVVAVVATPLRRQLATPWPWLGALLSLLLFAPNAWWQWQHDFVYLDFVRAIHARDVRIGRTDGFLAGQLLVGAGPLLAALWIAGLGWLAFAKTARPWRLLAWLYAAALLLFWVSQARDYYLAPAYPMLLSAGCVALVAGIARLRPAPARIAHVGVALVVCAAFAMAAVVSLPIAPIGSEGWRISRRVHDNFAEQIGWPELVAQVAAVYRALPPAERAHAAIFANNYGEAGAIGLYGPALGLPRAISPINSYWALGYGDAPPETVIVLGDDAQGMADAPGDCTLAARVRIPHGIENEESGHPDIYVCRHLRMDFGDAWPQMRGFG